MFNHLSILQKQSFELCKQKWSYVFDQLNQEIAKWKTEKKPTSQNKETNGDIIQKEDDRTDNYNNETMETNFHEPAGKAFQDRIQIHLDNFKKI